MTKFEDFVTAYEAMEERSECPPDRELRDDEMCALFLVNKMMRKDEIFGAFVVTMKISTQHQQQLEIGRLPLLFQQSYSSKIVSTK